MAVKRKIGRWIDRHIDIDRYRYSYIIWRENRYSEIQIIDIDYTLIYIFMCFLCIFVNYDLYTAIYSCFSY